jgi:regulatory protein
MGEGARRSPPSLKGRALRWLAQREHSRTELRRKLLAAARADEAAAALDALPAAPGSAAPEAEPPLASTADTDAPPTIAARVDALLDWLEAQRYLSPQRFIETRVHARAARLGHRRIAGELAQHGLELPAELAQSLLATELERARAVWARKFTAAGGTASERARQARFLTGRGFSGEVVRAVLRRLPGDDEPPGWPEPD